VFHDIVCDDLCAKGYHIIDNFLETSVYLQLQNIAENLHQQGSFKNAKIGMQIQAQHNHSIRSDEILWLDQADEQEGVQRFLKKMHYFAHYLNQTLFLGLSEFETHFAVYPPGSYYKLHIDQFQRAKTRKISCVYYLNKSWQPAFGGVLNLYNEQNKLLEKVMPIGNRFICFKSELPHEVGQTERTRYSIAGWLKTRP
jgi:SM-20-related protein